MSSRGANGSDARKRQIDKITANPIFRGSESLCHLLRYLADQAIEHPGVSVKEYQLATEVFGRPSDFDPRLDSSVRVQTGRLRSKLAEYYIEDGAGDELVVELARGAYSLSFHPKASAPQTALATDGAATVALPAGRDISPILWLLAGMVIGAGCFWVYFSTRDRVTGQPAAPARELRTLWRGMLEAPESPLVVYSNAQFIGRPETGMRYFRPGIDPPQALMNHYTGVGEVTGIHNLTRTFSVLGRELRVKRGQLLSWDDAKNSNVIFVGSPSENLSLRELPRPNRFVFERETSGPRKGDLIIRDRNPAPNQPDRYHASDKLPIISDYAFISLMPGLVAGRWVMVLAGITTLGTEAAVEFVCRPAQVQKILDRLGTVPDAPVEPFEAVAGVKVSGGVPVETEIVAFSKAK